MKAYRERNREKINGQIQDWKKSNHDHYRQKEREHYHTPEGKAKHVARSTKTPKVVLLKALSNIRCHFNNPNAHDPKVGDPRRAFDLDDQHILDLWESQNGKCALTGMPLSLKRNDLAAISIDRIDSKKGHIKGNVQIVCQWVNYAKRHYSNSAMQDVLKQFYNIRKAEEDGDKNEE
jgi:hypothetical protein